ncbi:hypothetical protein [Aureispira sp. CCB-QB1]|uniref:hypothetical protein n=1 Tax=Aureispira sp. CCB-QB1 TaxID=1313421 RepID=UPI000697DED3|nr:hypothetical protein [Aureispira sp. CCB-QB1]
MEVKTSSKDASLVGKTGIMKVEELEDKEAMVGNAYQFRVKDFAAYYICRIKNIEAVYHETQAARDVEIEELKALLKEDK